MSPQKPNNTTLKVTSAIVVTIAVVMLSIASTVTKAQPSTQSGIISRPTTSATTTPNTTTVTATTPPAASTGTTSPSSGYKDGTYTAISDYYVPRSSEEIQVSLTLKNGVVTDSSIQNSEGDRQSAQYQRAFASSYKSYVTGKNIADINLSYVAGASDTTQGFNDAVSQIQTQAKA
jgi:uncharacterized protein with FMN-binding domain